jgi:phage/plasmid-like protein (TIGR03299 family)
MAHELDINNGVASFAARTDAWHRLGQTVGHSMTGEEALAAARLTGWNVRKMALQVPLEPVITDDGGEVTPAPLPVAEHFATVRTNPITGNIDVLGVVGSKYEPVQNEESCALLNALTDESGAVFETAGALRGGRETFVTMKMPESMSFDGIDGSKDRTDFFLAALNSHDGSSKFRFLVTPIRIVCANTQTAAIEAASASWGIRHTGGARAAIQEARTTLKLSWRYMQAFEEEAAQLYSQAMDIDQMRDFAAELVEVDKAESRTAARNRSERAAGIVKLWTSSPTIGPIAGTRWAAYNAVTEYADHYAKVRTNGDQAAARALRAVTIGSTAQGLKARAFRMLQTV